MSKGTFILGLIVVLATFPISIPMILCGVCNDKNTQAVEPSSTRQIQSENPIGVLPPPIQKEIEDNPVNV
jgi:hypothetical protein